MGFVDATRRNAPFFGVLFAIMLAAFALVAALVALMARMS